jgi:ABC-type branched-subunit amino acid transport system substrate-binding protein
MNARLEAYKAAGGECADTDFEIVRGDDTSSPQGALAAAQKLVQQDDVYAVLPITPFLPAAASYLATQASDTPVLGVSFDASPQWLDESATNFFSASGSIDTALVSSTFGDYWTAIGGTKVAVVSPEAGGVAAKAAVQSGVEAGLEEGYTNYTLPIGGTDVGAIVLGIKDSGADVAYLSATVDTGFAIVAGLRQAGVEMKSILLPTGYGADLLASEPARQAAQGVSFLTTTPPTELETEASQFQADALREYAGSETGISSFSQNQGWLAADLFLYGLEAAGCDASQADFIETLRSSTTWDASGLYQESVDFSELGNLPNVNSPGNCFYVSTFEGDQFIPDPAASPICGEVTGRVDQ